MINTLLFVFGFLFLIFSSNIIVGIVIGGGLIALGIVRVVRGFKRKGSKYIDELPLTDYLDDGDDGGCD